MISSILLLLLEIAKDQIKESRPPIMGYRRPCQNSFYYKGRATLDVTDYSYKGRATLDMTDYSYATAQGLRIFTGRVLGFT